MKLKILTAIIIVTLCLIIYYTWINGWLVFIPNTDTPTQYFSNVRKSDVAYRQDKVKLTYEFEILQKRRKGFFYNTAFSDTTTQIVIDSILYSTDFKKMAVFIIAKNPTSRQPAPQKGDWYYNSTCYLGIRKGKRIHLEMAGPTFTNAESLEEASKDIRVKCFRNYVRKDSGIYQYNMNDKRFWNSKIWEHYFN